MRASLSFASSIVLLLGGCYGDGSVTRPGVELYDPQGLMDVVGDLRLVVFPSEGYGCTADGTVTPELSDARDAVFADAVVDITVRVGDSAQLDLLEGSYVVHVRGRGTDPVTGRTDVIVATGCTPDVTIAPGETREITVELKDVVGMGVCDDGILSPDEQCEATTGPLPCTACRTQSFVTHTTTDANQDSPSVGWATGARLVLAFDSSATSPRGVRTMFRSDRGESISSPAALAIDADVDDGMAIPGVQSTSAVAVSSARIGIAFGDFQNASTQGGDALVRFFDADRNPAGNATLATPQAGAQTELGIAMLPDGTALVVFTDGASASGASAVRFAAGSTTPDTAVAIGMAGASAPSVAASSSGFVVAFVAAGGIAVQRFDAAGTVLDPTPISVAAAGSTPTVAALADGRFFVAWADGATVRGRAFDATGTAATDALSVGSGQAPSAGAGAERFVVAWESGGSVLARLYDGSGAAARNRENPPTPEAFTVAAGATPVVAVGGPASQAMAFVGFVAGGDVQGRLYPLP
ncbi:MAG: hypothetical protein H6722_07370 [Sandaracinus sp.]|nr:hypothetical protein [Sandaracinus sp.]MCB9612256.1 hypothetical protein [Sandaracinus sp.]MCB9618320.1 hypothetical protein [Sandaracinus sp.]